MLKLRAVLAAAVLAVLAEAALDLVVVLNCTVILALAAEAEAVAALDLRAQL
jgi:hypothetical protein